MTLGKTELEVLHIIWDLKEASVNDVHERILKKRKVAYTTIMTVMKILVLKEFFNLENKVELTYTKQPKSRSRNCKRRNYFISLLDKVFNGSAHPINSNSCTK